MHLAWWLMTGKSYVKFFFRLHDNNNNTFCIHCSKDCRLFPIRNKKQHLMEFGTVTMEAKRKKSVHNAMKRIVCRDFCAFFSLQFSTMGQRIWFIFQLCHTNRHTNAFHLAHKQYQMLEEGEKNIQSKHALSTNTMAWIGVTQKADFHVESSAFRYIFLFDSSSRKKKIRKKNVLQWHFQ